MIQKIFIKIKSQTENYVTNIFGRYIKEIQMRQTLFPSSMKTNDKI